MTIFIGCVYGIYQNARQSANLSDLYQTFHIFQRLIDKAVTTMPEYVDFEVLFTKKEIAKGIPALNEYLEKRARQEQEELEKARRNAVDHEVYDFGSVDISGSLILDRAMKETEIYLSLRNRLLAEIQQVESQIDTLKKSYDNTQREIQRKMQTAKENIERIRMQQESSTNRIEGNYLKKQQDQEISKLTQLEKDNTEETYRFNQELEALTSEIDKKKAELEERRKYIEKAMLAEYKTYSTKVFKNLLKVAKEKEKEERETLAETKDSYAQQIVELKDQVQELSYENTQLKDRIKNFDSELSEKESFYTNALIETAEKAKSALVGKKGDSTTEEIEIPSAQENQPETETPVKQETTEQLKQKHQLNKKQLNNLHLCKIMFQKSQKFKRLTLSKLKMVKVQNKQKNNLLLTSMKAIMIAKDIIVIQMAHTMIHKEDILMKLADIMILTEITMTQTKQKHFLNN